MLGTTRRRLLLGAALGCLAGSAVWVAGLLLTSIAGARGLGPFGEFLGALHSTDAAHGRGAAMHYMLSDQAAALGARMALLEFFTFVLPACLVAGVVGGMTARSGPRVSLAVGALASAGPLLLSLNHLSLYLAGPLLPCTLCAAVGAMTALGVSVIRRSR